ncbi:unnamed protein product [Linum trigynum]|uniref:Secreted protein n=1 Tax=Linum trigynum TaxID=586398 RepID=A0AAV2GN66_9ROSI
MRRVEIFVLWWAAARDLAFELGRRRRSQVSKGRLSASFGAFGSHFGELEPKHGQPKALHGRVLLAVLFMPRANSVWPIQLQTQAPKHGRV